VKGEDPASLSVKKNAWGMGEEGKGRGRWRNRGER